MPRGRPKAAATKAEESAKPVKIEEQVNLDEENDVEEDSMEEEVEYEEIEEEIVEEEAEKGEDAEDEKGEAAVAHSVDADEM